MVDDPALNDDPGTTPDEGGPTASDGGRLGALRRLRGRIRRPRLRLPVPGARTIAVRGRELSVNLRLVVAVIVVGLVGFAAGWQFRSGTGGGSSTPSPSVAVAASPTGVPASPSSIPAVVAGSSAMAGWFAPEKLVAGSADAGSCAVQPGPTGTGGAWWQRVWFAHCRLAAARRDRVVDEVGRAVSDGFVATGLTGTGSYFVSNRSGPEIGHWTYEASGLDGSIQLLRYDAGTDLELVFVISEHAKG